MHVPNPLGGLPLVLRSSDISNPRDGELLMDYTKDYLYYVNKESGEKIGIADSIYKKLIAAKLENSYINVVQSDGMGEEPEKPAVEDRKMNNWYFDIKGRLPVN